MLSDITQNSLELVFLDFGFVSDELVRHRLRYDRFGTKSILAGTPVTDYILYGTYKNKLYSIQYVHNRLYSTWLVRTENIIL